MQREVALQRFLSTSPDLLNLEFERDIIRDRVKAGVKAKREKINGVWGRTKVADMIQTKIQELIKQGVSIRTVAKQLNVAKGTVMKYK